MGDETRVQIREAKKGAEALGGIIERYMIRFLGPVGRKIAASTRAGRVMALIGVVAVLVSLILIITDALTFHKEMTKGVLVAAKSIVNVRDRAGSKGRVIAKAQEGDRLGYIAYSDGWYKVRAAGNTGWVSEDMVSQKGSDTVVIEYQMKGYGIPFLAGLALFVVGIMQQKKK